MDTVTLDESGYSVIEGSEVVTITLTRSGDLLNDITIPFRAHAIPDANNAAIRKICMSLCGCHFAQLCNA